MREPISETKDRPLGPAQGCTAGGRAPLDAPYECDRCDLGTTGVCAAAQPQAVQEDASEQFVTALRGLTADEQADLYDAMSDAAEHDDATTYMNDRLYDATARLVEVHMRKLLGADAIRGGPKQPTAPKLHRL